MAQDGKEDLEASKEGSWKNGVAADADIECTYDGRLISYMSVVKDDRDRSSCKHLI